MKRMGTAKRIILWLVVIAWIPVIVEDVLNSRFHIEGRFEAAILIIPYMEFITMPLTCLAILIALFKGAKAIIGLLGQNRKAELERRAVHFFRTF